MRESVKTPFRPLSHAAVHIARGLREHPGVAPLLVIVVMYFLAGLDRSWTMAFAGAGIGLGLFGSLVLHSAWQAGKRGQRSQNKPVSANSGRSAEKTRP